MDLGLFRRTRVQFAAWLAGPIVVIAASYYALHAYCEHVERTLTDRRTLTEVVPEMQIQLKAAKETLRHFETTPASRNDATELVRARISRHAQEAGLVINSLSVMQPDELFAKKPELARNRKAGAAKPAGIEDRTPFLAVSVTGEGTLPAVLRFMDQAMGPQSLVVPETAVLETTHNEAEPQYTAEFLLRCYLVSL